MSLKTEDALKDMDSIAQRDELYEALESGRMVTGELPSRFAERYKIVDPASKEGRGFQEYMQGLLKKLLPDYPLDQEPIPTKIQDNLDAQAFYGALLPTIKSHLPEGTSAEATAAEISLAALSIIKKHLIVNIWQNPDAMKKIQNTLDDYFFDVVGPEMAVSLTPDELDKVLESLMAIARARFPG